MNKIKNIILNKNPINMIENLKQFIIENKNLLVNLKKNNNIILNDELKNINFIPNNVNFLDILDINNFYKKNKPLDIEGKMLYNLCSIEYMAIISYTSTFFNFLDYKYINDDYLIELIEVILDETRHFLLVNSLLEKYKNINFGIYPINKNILTDLQMSKQNLIKRICMISLVNEVRGVDSGEFLLKKLISINSKEEIKNAFSLIIKEEELHVKFGIKWFKYFSSLENINYKQYFQNLMKEIKFNKSKINIKARNKIGFDFY